LPQFESKPTDQKLQLELNAYELGSDSFKTIKPAVVFRNKLIYKFPDQIDPFQMRVQIPDTVYDAMLPAYDNLKLNAIELKKGEEIAIGSEKYIKLIGFTKDIDPDIVTPDSSTIALAAQIEFRDNNLKTILNPVYIIRNNQVISIPVQSIYPGITLKFTKINPQTELMSFEYALHPEVDKIEIPISVSENAPRNDFIVIQVISFPWINLVWLGGIIMLSGLLLSFFIKRNMNKNEA
jgi:hypothetical protein